MLSLNKVHYHALAPYLVVGKHTNSQHVWITRMVNKSTNVSIGFGIQTKKFRTTLTDKIEVHACKKM